MIAETERETGISVENYILYPALTGSWLMDGSEVVTPSAGESRTWISTTATSA